MLRRFVTAFAVTAIFFASVLNVCTKMMAMVSMGDMEMLSPGMAMSDCMLDVKGCLIPITDHMRPFAQVNPFSVTNEFAALIFAILAVVFVTTHVAATCALLKQRLREYIRTSLRELIRSYRPTVFEFAFSQGILHSKIFA